MYYIGYKIHIILKDVEKWKKVDNVMESIYKDFLLSKKKHVIITGSKGSGKSTLFTKLANNLELDTMKTKHFEMNDGKELRVAFNDDWQFSQVVATYDFKTKKHHFNEGIFSEFIVKKLGEMTTEWIGIDEIGFLEANEEKFNQKILDLLISHSLILVLRNDKQTKLLKKLLHLEDAYYIDLDQQPLDLSCIVMASGFSQRFGSNKLLAYLNEKTLIEHCLMQIPYKLFKEVIIVTRYDKIVEIGKFYPLKYLMHDERYQNDTIKVGLQALKDVSGVMFVSGDQPLRTRESLIKMAFTFRNNPHKIVQLAYGKTVGNPLIFPQWSFKQLLALEQEKGGSSIIKNHKNEVVYVQALCETELFDVDTPEDLEKIRKMNN